jgi:hypothetical protein
MVIAMGTDFYRYHLPIVLIMAVCIAISTGYAWDQIRRRSHALSRMRLTNRRGTRRAQNTLASPSPAVGPRPQTPLVHSEPALRASTHQDPQR